MQRYSFIIKGIPQPKARPRARVFYQGRCVRAHIYTPKNTKSWERNIQLQTVWRRPKEIITAPIRMFLEFYLPRPKSLPKKVRYHIKRPDLDNLIKSVKDALEGIFYKNDSQIYTLSSRKVYATEEAGVKVELIVEGGGE